MNSNKSLSGEYLKILYTENKLDDHLQTPENLRTLLNYELDCMGDTFDSNSSFEIIDFCIDKLKDLEPVDEQKINFLGQKIQLESKEFQRKMKFRHFRRFATMAATIGVIAGVMFFANEEGYAGKFDLLHLLTTQDKGEQLSLDTSDMTLNQFEIEEGHLPDTLPDQFSFEKSHKETSSPVSAYTYTFIDSNQIKLKIHILDFSNDYTHFNKELEINRNSSEIKSFMNHECYYNSNYDIKSISWAIDNKIYTVFGEFRFHELEEIVSLYLKEDN